MHVEAAIERAGSTSRSADSFIWLTALGLSDGRGLDVAQDCGIHMASAVPRPGAEPWDGAVSIRCLPEHFELWTASSGPGICFSAWRGYTRLDISRRCGTQGITDEVHATMYHATVIWDGTWLREYPLLLCPTIEAMNRPLRGADEHRWISRSFLPGRLDRSSPLSLYLFVGLSFPLQC